MHVAQTCAAVLGPRRVREQGLNPRRLRPFGRNAFDDLIDLQQSPGTPGAFLLLWRSKFIRGEGNIP
ncbi:hypothetical protein, partial [Mesorhizobium sp. P5_C1]